MKLKFPPLLLTGGLALLLLAAAFTLPGLSVGFPGQVPLAALFAAAGAVFLLLTARSFRRVRTTFNPMKPETSSQLVTSGLNRVSRNPMYLGMLSMLTAIALATGTLAGLVILPGFVWYMTRFQIRPEEAALETLFGDQYRTYKTQVRRWI